MTAENLLSRSITNLDGNNSASPIALSNQYDTAGFNIGARLVEASDYCAATTGGLGSTSSTYKLVRLRSNVKIKAMRFFVSTALDTGGLAAALKFDIGAYYSDSTVDGTQPQLQGTLISASCFYSALVSPAAGYNNAVVSSLCPTAVSMDQMLWDFLGLTAPAGQDAIYGDPGGYIDIVAKVNTIANTAAAGNLAIEVYYAE